jgi:uncharacterized membrane protein
MQNSPAVPPDEAPPPAVGPSGPTPATGTGTNKRLGAVLSYLFWWISGIVLLFAGKEDGDVKYHAAQSVVFFGAVSALRLLLGVFAGVLGLRPVLLPLSGLLFLFAFVIWIVCLCRAWIDRGERFELPLVGGLVKPYAERLAASVS